MRTILTRFSPRFVYWQVFDYPPLHYLPEVFRAIDVLHQLHDPWGQVPHAIDRAPLRWRLLFPGLGHILHLPDRVFLALPHLGCLAVLGAVADIVYRDSADRKAAFLSAALAGTASWFFVSTGWLGYFDSWYVLCLVLVSFTESRAVIVAVCIVAPWIDERFVFALPLCLVVRSLYFQLSRSAQTKELQIDAILASVPVLLYCTVRALSVLVSNGFGVWCSSPGRCLCASSGTSGSGWIVVRAPFTLGVYSDCRVGLLLQSSARLDGCCRR